MRYSIEPRDRIFVKGYWCLSFGEKMCKKLSNKYGYKLLDSAKKSAADAIKTVSKRAIQKTEEATGDKTAGVSKSSAQLHSKSQNNNANNETDVTKERYVSQDN